MYGLLRGEGNEDDPYRFAAQWGYAPGYNATWQAVTNWTEMNFGPISKRTDPAALVKYTAKFVAQTSDITLYIRGWKKWGIPNVEMDFNLDGVMVTACGGHGGPVQPIEPPLEDGCWSAPDCGAVWPSPPVEWPGGGCGSAPDCGAVWPQPPIAPPPVEWPGGGCGSAPDCGGGTWPGGGCTVVVQPGDTLASIAWQMGVSLHELIAVNNIYNPDLIFVGQTLTLPGCGGQATPHPGGPVASCCACKPAEHLHGAARRHAEPDRRMVRRLGDAAVRGQRAMGSQHDLCWAAANHSVTVRVD
jgi:hypothetical protein